MESPRLPVDVDPVRLHPQGRHLGPELREHQGGHAVGRSVGGVDHHPNPIEREIAGKGGLGEGHVATARVLQLLRAPDPGPDLAGPQRLSVGHESLDLRFGLVGQLESVAPENLDAVVGVWVVAGADHDAGVGPHADREVSHGGGGDGSAEQNPASHRANARGDRGLDHVPGEAGVLADDDPGRVPLAPAGHVGDGPPEGEGQLRGHGVLVGHAPDAVGAKELPGGRAGHDLSPSSRGHGR